MPVLPALRVPRSSVFTVVGVKLVLARARHGVLPPGAVGAAIVAEFDALHASIVGGPPPALVYGPAEAVQTGVMAAAVIAAVAGEIRQFHAGLACVVGDHGPTLPQKTVIDKGNLGNNLKRMTCATFRQAGYFMGSGVVEAGCKSR
jgi:hypothetical protein